MIGTLISLCSLILHSTLLLLHIVIKLYFTFLLLQAATFSGMLFSLSSTRVLPDSTGALYNHKKDE